MNLHALEVLNGSPTIPFCCQKDSDKHEVNVQSKCYGEFVIYYITSSSGKSLCLCRLHWKLRPEGGGWTWPNESSCIRQSWLQNPNHYFPNCGFSSPGHTISKVHFVEAEGLQEVRLNWVSVVEKLKRMTKKEHAHLDSLGRVTEGGPSCFVL